MNNILGVVHCTCKLKQINKYCSAKKEKQNIKSYFILDNVFFLSCLFSLFFSTHFSTILHWSVVRSVEFCLRFVCFKPPFFVATVGQVFYRFENGQCHFIPTNVINMRSQQNTNDFNELRPRTFFSIVLAFSCHSFYFSYNSFFVSGLEFLWLIYSWTWSLFFAMQ